MVRRREDKFLRSLLKPDAVIEDDVSAVRDMLQHDSRITYESLQKEFTCHLSNLSFILQIEELRLSYEKVGLCGFTF